MKGRPIKPILVLMTAVLALAACHHGSSSNSSSFTIGGSITGLSTGSVELANGSSTVAIASGATSWVFPNSFASGSSYSVTVVSQPSNELCEVSGGSGDSLTGNIDTVTVECSDYGQWIWEGGSQTVNASGVYGTQGTASASNAPGARYSANSWIDSSGNLWLFGGAGYDSNGHDGDLNDLWRYSPGTNQWTWISGGSAGNAAGVYGTLGTRRGRQCAGSALCGQFVDRCVRQSVAVWRYRL